MSAVGVEELVAGTPGGPLVVLAHGIEDGWESWRPLAARLPSHWRVVALDLPWRSGNDYAWRQRAAGDWLAEGLDRVGGPATAVIGHSFGANATLELMCARDPRYGRAAVLICPMYRPPALAVTWAVFDRSRQTFVKHIGDGIRARLGSRSGRVNPELLATMTAKTLDRVGPVGFLAVFDQFAATAHLRLEQADRPALILAGGADETLTPARAQALAGRLSAAELSYHDDYDHFCHIRRAADLAATVTRFLAGALRGQPTEGALG